MPLQLPIDLTPHRLFGVSFSEILKMPKVYVTNFKSKIFAFVDLQAFRFMVGPGHCPMISRYGPQNSWQYSKTCLRQPLKIDKTKFLITNGSFMKVKRIAECDCRMLPLEHSAILLTLEHSAILLTCISDNWSSFLSGLL